MKTLVVGDIHQDLAPIKNLLETTETFDEIVFLGDWFDSHKTPPEVASFEETCTFLKSLLENLREKCVFLLGNHDLSYIARNTSHSHTHIKKTPTYSCSGFTNSKGKKFRKAFFDQGLKDTFFTEHFKPAHLAQGWLLSHAGVMGELFPYGCSRETLVNENLLEAWKNFRLLAHPYNPILSQIGRCRGGEAPFGGVLWCDANEEFRPSTLAGKQLFGHTSTESPQGFALGTPKESWNINTGNHYAILNEGNLTICPFNR
jgi:hypothetical protein